MELAALIKSLLALSVVGGLMLAASMLLRKFGPEKFLLAMQKKAGEPKRLSIQETLLLDARRRLVLVKCDDTEHLLLLGATSEQVIALEGKSHARP